MDLHQVIESHQIYPMVKSSHLWNQEKSVDGSQPTKDKPRKAFCRRLMQNIFTWVTRKWWSLLNGNMDPSSSYGRFVASPRTSILTLMVMRTLTPKTSPALCLGRPDQTWLFVPQEKGVHMVLETWTNLSTLRMMTFPQDKSLRKPWMPWPGLQKRPLT